MIFVGGFLAGMLMTIPPGPAGFAILKPSLVGQRSRAWMELLGFATADILVLWSCIFWKSSLAEFFTLSWVKFVAGAFLVVLALRLFRAHRSSLQGSGENPRGRSFWWTLFNPAVWLSNLALVGLGAGMPLRDFAWYIAGIQLGYLAWYVLVILFASKVPPIHRLFVERAAVSCILGAGVLLSAQSIFS